MSTTEESTPKQQECTTKIQEQSSKEENKEKFLDVSLKTLNGRIITLKLPDDASVQDLKNELAKQDEYEAEGLKLVLKGKVAENPQTLKELNYAPPQAFIIVAKRKNSITSNAIKKARIEREKREAEKQTASPAPQTPQQQTTTPATSSSSVTRAPQRAQRQANSTENDNSPPSGSLIRAVFSRGATDEANEPQDGEGGDESGEQDDEFIVDSEELERSGLNEPQLLSMLQHYLTHGDPSDLEELLEEDAETDSQNEFPPHAVIPATSATNEASLSQADQDAIQRLMDLAQVSRESATHAYIAADKNEEIAANFLFD